MKTKLMLGDNIESLKKLPDNSIDSIVTDPPYALNFMNKKWDAEVPSVDFWKQVYRVLKPGGHILSFGGTRTYHRMVVNIEDAGFEIRDQIQWIYSTGFPKSHNIGKAVDKLEGILKTKGLSQYEGWGTALKPANEPICLARKPLSEKSVAENVLKWGTGGINVDGCRVGSDIIETNMKNTKGGLYNLGNEDRTNEVENTTHEGRFPANLILECICDEVIKGEKGEVKKSGFRVGGKSENSVGLNGVKNDPDNYNDKGDIHTNPMCPCRLLDEQSGTLKSGKYQPHHKRGKTLGEYQGSCYGKYNNQEQMLNPDKTYGDSGGASRFFYQAKVSKSERNMGLDGFEEKKKEFETDTRTNKETADKFGCERKGTAKNTHPCLKPINLMTYLCRLITPQGGIVLDPFMGSGSTGISALLEGFRFVGMEMDEDYFKIAEARINAYEKYRKFIK